MRQSTGSLLVPFLLLLMVGTAIGFCIVLVKTMPPSQAAVSPEAAPVPEPVASQKSKKPRKQAASSKKSGEPVVHVPSLESKDSDAIHTVVPSSDADENASALSVKADSTPVFQSNSTNSSLVTSLNKGDEVKSGGLQILDSQGTWTLVRGQGRSGFVASESLERKTPSEQAQR